jgi:hypothetical protein
MQMNAATISIVIAVPGREATRGSDPAIHLLRMNMMQSGWIRGSNPRVTIVGGRDPGQIERDLH